MSKIELAKKFAQEKHLGQKDKAGVDYFRGHLMAVYKKTKKMTHDENVHVVALLHDVIEDTNATYDEVKTLFGKTIADSVLVLTKTNGTYQSYLNKVKRNSIARVVKIADMTHNSNVFRLPNPSKEDFERAEKYKKAIKFLKQ